MERSNSIITRFRTGLIGEPYHIFLSLGLFLIITSFFSFGESVDFHLRDTYYVVSANYFIWAWAGVFILAWFIYKLLNKFLWTKKLIWAHMLLTIISLLVAATNGLWRDAVSQPTNKTGTSFEEVFNQKIKSEGFVIYLACAMFLLGLIAFIANLVVGLLQKRK